MLWSRALWKTGDFLTWELLWKDPGSEKMWTTQRIDTVCLTHHLQCTLSPMENIYTCSSTHFDSCPCSSRTTKIVKHRPHHQIFDTCWAVNLYYLFLLLVGFLVQVVQVYSQAPLKHFGGSCQAVNSGLLTFPHDPGLAFLQNSEETTRCWWLYEVAPRYTSNMFYFWSKC